jgi:hypothetical protein
MYLVLARSMMTRASAAGRKPQWLPATTGRTVMGFASTTCGGRPQESRSSSPQRSRESGIAVVLIAIGIVLGFAVGRWLMR